MSLIDVCYIRSEEFEAVRNYLQKDNNVQLAIEQQIKYFSKVNQSFEAPSSMIQSRIMQPRQWPKTDNLSAISQNDISSTCREPIENSKSASQNR
jgi:hypothetical protein